jgi:hypothetical protein
VETTVASGALAGQGICRARRRVRHLVALALAGVAAAVVPASSTAPTGPRAGTGAPHSHHVPAPATSASGTLPPNNPPGNISPNPNFLSNCSGSAYDNSAGCTQAVLKAIANARAQEGLPPMAPPSDWYTLSAQQQMYVATNLERTVRGLPPLTGLATALDQASTQGAANSQDPSPPSGFPWSSWGSNWAGAVGNPLEAMYFWMYDDGMNSGNIDCTPSNQSGCWGHRDNVLMNLSCHPCDMGTGYVGNGYQGYPSWAELLVDTSGSPQLDYSWDQVTPYLSGSPGGAGFIDPDLQEFIPDHANNRVWNAYDQTTSSGGPGILGSPVSVGIANVHVYAQGANGDLIEYVNDNTNGHTWNAYDLSYFANHGSAISGKPSVVYNGLLHVYVQAANGDLTEYVNDNASGHLWNAYDLSYFANHGSAISGATSAVSNGLVHVYVRGANGDLVEYVNDNASGHQWNAYDLSYFAGYGVPVSSAPAPVVVGSLVHVYVEGTNYHLEEFLNDGANGHLWNAYDLSVYAGNGANIYNAPGVVVSGSAIHVYAQGMSTHLTEYVNDSAGGHLWNAYDLSYFANHGVTVSGTPSGVFNGLIHIYSTSTNGHLEEFVNDNANGHQWNTYDLSYYSQGPGAATDPSAVFWGGGIHVYVGGD